MEAAPIEDSVNKASREVPEGKKEVAQNMSREVWAALHAAGNPSREMTTVKTGLTDLKIDSKTASERTAAVDKNAATAGELKDSERKEANQFLFRAAQETVNKSIYRLPAWANLEKPPPGLGCVSSFSNRYRQALQYAGVLDSANSSEHRSYYQVNMDELNKAMGRDNLFQPLSKENVRAGDVIQGFVPGSSSRHIGIVGDVEKGQRMVYDNYGGIWRKEPLDSRFGKYSEIHYYRAYMPAGKDQLAASR